MRILDPSQGSTRFLRASVIVLSAIGVTAGIARLLLMDDLLVIGDSYRARFFRDVGLHDPFAGERPAEMAWFDQRFGAHPVLTTLHAGLGSMILILAPLQLVTRLRRRFVGFHRWSGRVVIVGSIVVVGSSLPFGIVVPFGGWAEVVATFVVGSICVFSMARGFIAIRERDVIRHREWMLRGFAALIGIAAIRVVGAVLDLALTPLGVSPRSVFAWSLWLGWGITGFAVELRIRRTRDASGNLAGPNTIYVE